MLRHLTALLLLTGCGDKDDTGTAAVDADGDGFIEADDCDDSDAAVNPGAAEVCDGIDNNCDELIDDDSAADMTTWYVDADADGYGDAAGTVDACDQPDGYAASADDCDDASSTISPGADEVCDDLDNNCDGSIDEDAAVDASTWYADTDLDGFGDPSNTAAACTQPDGYITDAADCDDTSDQSFPGADEYCDGIDNNCDGSIDEDAAVDASTWYQDGDGDGYGNPDASLVSCDQPDGYVLDDSDCDDTGKGGSCYCTLDGIGKATTVASNGTTYGAWMSDPEETLGAGLYWEMDGYSNVTTVMEYPSLADYAAETNGTTLTLADGFDGSGGAVLDGYLYYNQADTNVVVKYDLDLQKAVDTMVIKDAGYHNTYPYSWYGYSDIDLMADENGLWAIYGTSGNAGKMVVSTIDPDKFEITQTWNTDSDLKSYVGNAFIICGVVYGTDSFYSTTATVNYAFDTSDGTSWDPGFSIPTTHGYVTQIDYNPRDGLLYVWDLGNQVTFPTTISY